MKTKEEKQQERARKAMLRAAGIELVMLTALAGGKAERYRALAAQCDQVKKALLLQADSVEQE